MSERCGTCAHWLTIDDEWGDGATPVSAPNVRDAGGEELRGPDGSFGSRVRAPGRWGFCGRAGRFGPREAGRFYVIDGSEYLAKMGTREDFGCVEHEPKTEA